MKLPISIVNAFTRDRFGGNPAAVVQLPHWLPRESMQAVAHQNNLSETAFLVRESDTAFAIRWFSPLTEIAFCGHAALASAHVIAREQRAPFPITLRTAAVGELPVVHCADIEGFEMSLPQLPAHPVHTLPPALLDGLSNAPVEVLRNAQAYVAVYTDEQQIRELVPDLGRLKALAPWDVVVTAPGERHDFVSRYFWPSKGGSEDPVTGSIHTALAPYWAERLGKSRLRAMQASARSGELHCRVEASRVHVAGSTVHYLDGHIQVDDGLAHVARSDRPA